MEGGEVDVKMTQTRPPEIKLLCGVYHIAQVLTIEASLDARVDVVRNTLSGLLDIPPAELTLYKAKTKGDNGQWVKADENLDEFLSLGPVKNESGEMEFPEIWPPQPVSRIYEQGPGRIHVLVELPKLYLDHVLVGLPKNYLKRQKTEHNTSEGNSAGAQWELVDSDSPTSSLDAEKRLVRIPWELLKISGATILREGHDLQLYCRPETVDEWRKIQCHAVDTYAQVFICGAPGTGKTCAAFAFAFGAVDRDLWDIVWIHFDQAFTRFLCYMVKGKELWAAEAWNDRDLNNLLVSSKLQERRAIVFYDGYNTSQPACDPVLLECRKWFSRNNLSRRLVIVTSMVSLGKEDRPETYQPIKPHVEVPGEKINPWLNALDRLSTPAERNVPDQGMEADAATEVLDVHVFELLSWILDEYRTAVKENVFFDSVEHALRDGAKAVGAADTPYEDRVALVEKKFYVAGGSARMMFAVMTSRAMDSLDRALMSVDSLKSFAEFDAGVLSGGTVNRLLALYRDGMNKTQQRIVSSYAVRELGIKLGPDKFLETVSLLRMNPSMDGFIFEGWVIGCLAHGPLTLKQLASGGNVEWKHYPLVHFDIAQLQLKLQALSTKQWLVPFKSNQSGYDIVFLDKTRGVVRFVQVTRASRHSFAAKAFCDFFNMLHACKWMDILSVELCYVLPRENDEPKPKPFISKEELYRQVIAVVFLQGKYRPFEEKKSTRKTLETSEGTPITYSVDTLEAAYDAIYCHDMELQRQEMHGREEYLISELEFTTGRILFQL